MKSVFIALTPLWPWFFSDTGLGVQVLSLRIGWVLWGSHLRLGGRGQGQVPAVSWESNRDSRSRPTRPHLGRECERSMLVERRWVLGFTSSFRLTLVVSMVTGDDQIRSHLLLPASDSHKVILKPSLCLSSLASFFGAPSICPLEPVTRSWKQGVCLGPLGA